jgi:hypothetical protein
MATLLSTKEPVRFAPAEQDGIAYVLRVPTVYDRARLRRACLARGARHWPDLEMMAVLADGVRKLLVSDEDAERRTAFLADIEEHTALLATEQEVPPELIARIAEIEAAVVRGYAPYAERVADRTYWQDVLPIEAVRLLLAGWEGIEDLPEIGPEGLSERSLSMIPDRHLGPLGLRALSLFAPTEQEAKNSVSPSAGASASTTSPAARPSPTKTQ